MYRRLESKPEKIEFKDDSAESECNCSCRTEKATDGEKKPDANLTANQLRLHYDING